MTILSTLTQQSGSLGETVFSRNQHGPYTRDRTVPTDPSSARQVVVRAALSECVNAWKSTLTETERQAWDQFALAVRTRTALGRSTNAGGLGMFIRANVPRIQAALGGSPRIDQAPLSLTSAPFTPITRVVLNVNDDTLHPFFAESDAWSTESGAAMLFYASAPQPLTRNFWQGPYRLAGDLSGSDPTLSSPGTIPLPQPAVLGQRVFVRGRLTLSDARTTEPFRLPADTVPQVAPLPLSAKFTSTGGIFGFVIVTFDALLRRQPHAQANWTVRFNNGVWTVLSAVTLGSTIRLNLRSTVVAPPLDQVVFSPPPFDVNGLLTGIPVAPFTIPLV